jgi:transposase
VTRHLMGRRGRPARCLSVEAIRGLYGQGYSFRAIAETTGIGYGTVRRAFHGLAPLGADVGEDQFRPRRLSKPKRKFKTATAGAY